MPVLRIQLDLLDREMVFCCGLRHLEEHRDMPSMSHETLGDLFRARPSLAAEILGAPMEAMLKGYEYQSDFAKKYFAQGFTEGLSRGRAEGLAEETARSLLTVLRARGIAVPDAVRERILAQKDPERLERWLEKAAVATSLAAVIDEPT